MSFSGQPSTPQQWKIADAQQFKPMKLSKLLPQMDKAGIDLLSRLLQYDPAKRLSARAAMRHPYFNELKSNIQWEAPCSLLPMSATAPAELFSSASPANTAFPGLPAVRSTSASGSLMAMPLGRPATPDPDHDACMDDCPPTKM